MPSAGYSITSSMFSDTITYGGTSMNRNRMQLFFLMMLVLCAIHVTFAEEPANAKNATSLAKTMTSSSYRPMDINNIFNYYSNSGDGSFNPYTTNNEGFEIPIGQHSATCFFEDGLVWTAFKNNQLYCGGSTYNHGLQAGPIVTYGTASTSAVADDPSKPANRVYRVRPDIRPTGNADTIALETSLLQASEVGSISRYQSTTASALLQQYWDDWNQWPAVQGAPYTDVNGDGIYEAYIDIPGIPGSDQTQWMVMNDLNTTLTGALYSSYPIGIELQRTIWAYNRAGALGNTIFVGYKLINKSGVELDSMYVAQWCDPDLGFAGDDAAGCDTTLELGYVYNGQSDDANLASLDSPPPTAGFCFVQGPMVSGMASDTAIFNMRKVAGKKNLPTTGFAFFINGSTTFGDPNLAANGSNGTQQWYNVMRGFTAATVVSFPASVTGGSRYCYPGDPVTGTGPTYIGPAAVAGPADVRLSLSSGPFTMAPGDTQQVVIAAIAGVGGDYLHSIYTLKKYSYAAATAYKNLFNVAKTPLPGVPVDSITNNNDAIQIYWDNSTENFNQSGFSFEGYNVYQTSPGAAKLIATFDKSDGVTAIYGQALDPSTDHVTVQLQQSGTDSGLLYNFTATHDYITNAPFIKGEKYSYYVTAYSYSSGAPADANNTESNFQTHSVTFDHNLPGPNHGDQVRVTHSAGQADATIKVTIVDPSKLTGDQYKVSFHDERYTLGSSGTWNDITQPITNTKGLNKVDTLTGSSLSATGVWTDLTRTGFAIHNIVRVVSVDFAYCDGIQITFPAGLVIDSIFAPTSSNTGAAINYTYNSGTNTVTYGSMTGYSANGAFAGGEDIVVLSHGSPTLPIVMMYTMHDDGYSGGPIDVAGSDTLAAIANEFVTQHQWNVTDAGSGQAVLHNQTLYNGMDLYASHYYDANNGIYGPGGSSGSLFENVGPAADKIFDGITVEVNGSYTAPTTQGNVILNGNALSPVGYPVEWEDANNNWIITDFTHFGVDGTAANSITSFVPSSGGSHDLNLLQQDYELRWTGVLGDTVIGSDTVVITKSGGSTATLVWVEYPTTLATYPLNPTPGTNKPFTIRIPFEVWCTDKNEQVNLLVCDRVGNPAAPGFQVWNTLNRMYAWVVSTKYVTSVIDPTLPSTIDSLTWGWVFYKSNFLNGDDIKMVYNNPLQIGKDTYTFNVNDLLGVPARGSAAVKDYYLSQNYPNPFNPSTTIRYELPAPSTVRIRIYNILGQEVRTLVNQAQAAGQRAAIWDSRNNFGRVVSSGVYFYRIEAKGLSGNNVSFSSVKKMLLLK